MPVSLPAKIPRMARTAREQQLLSVALRLFVEHGYQGTAMGDIADAAGITRPVVYNCFGSKDALYLACLTQARQALEQSMLGAALAQDQPQARLRAGLEGYFQFIHANPLAWRLLYGSGVAVAGNAAEEAVRLRLHTVDAIAALFRLSAPEAPLGQLKIYAHAMSGAAEQVAKYAMTAPDQPLSTLIDTLMQFAWQGLEPLLAPARLELLPFGAQLLQASLAGRDLFYLSPGPHQPQAARRGGIPVLFPQFAGNGPLPKHGFARHRDWTLTAPRPDTCVARLRLTPADHPQWPHSAELTLTTVIDEALTQTLRIENTGSDTFSFSGGLHPYWAVSDVTSCRISGLDVSGLGHREVDEWHAGGEAITLTDGEHRLRLSQQGFQGWQVWNPGADHALSDMSPADWQRFVCLEPVMMTPIRLAPGGVFEGMLRAEVVTKNAIT